MSSMTVSIVPASSVPNFANYPASSKVPAGSSSSAAPAATSASSSTALDVSPAKTAAQQFQQWANMTPAQRLHAEMLAKLGLTEDQFKALPPAQQQKINDQIAQMIKKQMGDTNDTRTGLIADKTA
jgi:ABC-type transporter MlaC component